MVLVTGTCDARHKSPANSLPGVKCVAAEGLPKSGTSLQLKHADVRSITECFAISPSNGLLRRTVTELQPPNLRKMLA